MRWVWTKAIRANALLLKNAIAYEDNGIVRTWEQFCAIRVATLI